MIKPEPFRDDELEMIATGWLFAHDQDEKYIDVWTEQASSGVEINHRNSDENSITILAGISYVQALNYLALGIMAEIVEPTTEYIEMIEAFSNRLKAREK